MDHLIKQALIVLNNWLSTKFYDHWQIQALLQLLQIPPTEEFKRQKLIFRNYGKTTLAHLKLALGKEFATAWLPPRQKQDRPDRVPKCDLILGARWSTGKVKISQGFSFKFGYYTAELQPFQLEYPYFYEVDEFAEVDGPPDLEFLCCWSSNLRPERKFWHSVQLAGSLEFIKK